MVVHQPLDRHRPPLINHARLMCARICSIKDRQRNQAGPTRTAWSGPRARLTMTTASGRLTIDPILSSRCSSRFNLQKNSLIIQSRIKIRSIIKVERNRLGEGHDHRDIVKRLKSRNIGQGQAHQVTNEARPGIEARGANRTRRMRR